MKNSFYEEDRTKVLDIKTDAENKLAELEKMESEFCEKLEKVYANSNDTEGYNRLLRKARTSFTSLKDQARDLIAWANDWLNRYATVEQIEATALNGGFDLSSIPGYEEYYNSQNQ